MTTEKFNKLWELSKKIAVIKERIPKLEVLSERNDIYATISNKQGLIVWHEVDDINDILKNIVINDLADLKNKLSELEKQFAEL